MAAAHPGRFRVHPPRWLTEVAMRRNPLSSTTGTKFLMALSGIALILFLLLHLAGNLIVFAGPAAFNGYSATLMKGGPLVIAMELALGAIFLLHIYKAVSNFLANKAARPVPYAKKTNAGHTSRKSLASTWMIASGLFVLFFLIVHLRQFRFGEAVELAGVRNLYGLEMGVFSQPVWVVFYVVAMALIGMHLWHGFWSAFQSLGAGNSRFTPRLVSLAKVVAILIAGGFAIIPLWAFFLADRGGLK